MGHALAYLAPEFFWERKNFPSLPEKLQCKLGKGVTLLGTSKRSKSLVLPVFKCLDTLDVSFD